MHNQVLRFPGVYKDREGLCFRVREPDVREEDKSVKRT